MKDQTIVPKPEPVHYVTYAERAKHRDAVRRKIQKRPLVIS
jgi:hypothetical protein